MNLLWGIAGAALLLFLVLFVIRVPQDWVVAALEAAIALAFAVGAFTSQVKRLPLPRRPAVRLGLYGGLGLVAVVVAGLAPGWPPATGNPAESPQPGHDRSRDIELGYERVAPLGTLDDCSLEPYMPDQALWNGTCSPLGYDQFWGPQDSPSHFHPVLPLSRPGALAGFTELRLEIWRAVPAEGDFAVDPGESAPYLTVPLTIDGEQLSGEFDMSHARTNHWLAFATGEGTDGRRYGLGWQFDFGTTLYGTLWDWLTASG